MYCPYCHYTSFDHLPVCPKCNYDWSATRELFGLDAPILPPTASKDNEKKEPDFQKQDEKTILPAYLVSES